jgi:membrane protein involved in colicin uptake
METIYRVNGKEFEDKKKAERYEKILEEEKARKEKEIAERKAREEKLRAEREDRWKEVNEAYNNYYNLLKKFDEDYENNIPFFFGNLWR